MGQPNVDNAAPPGPGITTVPTPTLLTSDQVAYGAWFATLATTPPAANGTWQPWNDGGVLAFRSPT